MAKERIELTMSVMDILIELSEGNPGGLTVMMKLMEDGPKIDPEAWAKELQPLLSLDSQGIYGSDIWIFYKDVCGESTLNMLTAFRCAQMGLLPRMVIANWIHGGARISDEAFEGLREQLKEKLPSFNQEVANASAI